MKSNYKFLLIGSIILAVVLTLDFFVHLEKQSKPVTLELNLPKDEKTEGTKTKESDSTITILILENDQSYCYYGKDKLTGQVLALKDIREFLVNELKRRKDFAVIIKPFKGSTYKNSVDVLDEMTINNINKYEMVEPTQEDVAFIQDLKKRKD